MVIFRDVTKIEKGIQIIQEKALEDLTLEKAGIHSYIKSAPTEFEKVVIAYTFIAYILSLFSKKQAKEIKKKIKKIDLEILCNE
jgi:hypothetical protein